MTEAVSKQVVVQPVKLIDPRTTLEKQVIKIIEQFTKTKKMFEDPDFPTDVKSLYKDPKNVPDYAKNHTSIEWKRPQDLGKNPQMIKDGMSAGDVKQGAVEDSWLLGSFLVVSTHPEILQSLILQDGITYGFAIFQFCRGGKWQTVIIDTRLPYNSEAKQLCYASCKDPDEFWVPLMEKAYAKMLGNYEMLNHGNMDEGLTSLTGIRSVKANLQSPDIQQNVKTNKFWKELVHSYQQGFLSGCLNWVLDKNGRNLEGAGANGIINNLAYGIMKVQEVELEPGKSLRMMQIRNPWGFGEWKGQFCDGDAAWEQHKGLKEKLNYEFVDDGTWWMLFEDWVANFKEFYVCQVLPSTNENVKAYQESLYAQAGAGGAHKATTEEKIAEIVKNFPTTKAMFEDADFAPSDLVLYRDPKHPPEYAKGKTNVVWKRPHEFTKNPIMIKEGTTAGDVIQGIVDDSWLLGSFLSLTTRPELLSCLIVKDGIKYGFVAFQFYKNGKWQTVYIDTRLPYDATANCLIYGSCKDSDELWVPLMEKAYAKLLGNYELLNNGSMDEGLTSLTGKPCTKFQFVSPQVKQALKNDTCWADMLKNFSQGYVFGCRNIVQDANGNYVSGSGRNGIANNLAYGILDMREVELQDGKKLRMMQIRNPWGFGEWQGKFCDSDEAWDEHKGLQEALKYEFADDGTWWMTFKDWANSFSEFFVCFVVPFSSESIEAFQNKIFLQANPGIMHLEDKIARIQKNFKLQKTMFEDPEFPTTNFALYPDGKTSFNPKVVRLIEWKRPQDIIKDAVLVEDISKTGGFIASQEIQDSWLLGVFQMISAEKDLFQALLYQDGLQYGYVIFKFFILGRWEDIIIDTSLPYDKKNKTLLYGSSSNPKEFWIPLLEKAYAKVIGSFFGLHNRNATEALLFLTGYHPQVYNLQSEEMLKSIKNHSVWAKLQENLKEGGPMIGCRTFVQDEKKNLIIGVGDKGINNNLLHSIIGLKEIDVTATQKVRLIQMKNPYGNGYWSGCFAFNETSWDAHHGLKEKLNFKKDDGTMWISYEDWSTYFQDLIVNYFLPPTPQNIEAYENKQYLNNFINPLIEPLMIHTLKSKSQNSIKTMIEFLASQFKDQATDGERSQYEFLKEEIVKLKIQANDQKHKVTKKK